MRGIFPAHFLCCHFLVPLSRARDSACMALVYEYVARAGNDPAELFGGRGKNYTMRAQSFLKRSGFFLDRELDLESMFCFV